MNAPSPSVFLTHHPAVLVVGVGGGADPDAALAAAAAAAARFGWLLFLCDWRRGRAGLREAELDVRVADPLPLLVQHLAGDLRGTLPLGVSLLLLRLDRHEQADHQRDGHDSFEERIHDELSLSLEVSQPKISRAAPQDPGRPTHVARLERGFWTDRYVC